MRLVQRNKGCSVRTAGIDASCFEFFASIKREVVVSSLNVFGLSRLLLMSYIVWLSAVGYIKGEEGGREDEGGGLGVGCGAAVVACARVGRKFPIFPVCLWLVWIGSWLGLVGMKNEGD